MTVTDWTGDCYDLSIIIFAVFKLLILNCKEWSEYCLLCDIVLIQSRLHSLAAVLISENEYHD